MIVRIFALAIGVCCGLAYSADSVSHDLDGLRAMTTWNITQPNDPITCGIKEPSPYEPSRLDHEVGSDVDDQRASHAVALLEAEVTRYLKRHKWAPMNEKSCYRKGSVIVHTLKTSTRCKTNIPCTAYDGLSVFLYLPKTK